MNTPRRAEPLCRKLGIYAVGSGLKPVRTGHSKVRCSSLLLPVDRDRHSPTRNRERQNSCISKAVFREAGVQVSPVAMSHPSLWLHLVCCYKRPLKEEEGLFAFCFLSLGLYFGLFDVGSFWKGKELLKGKC
jgi:hypothetical protein